jgi:hypothetical protein
MPGFRNVRAWASAAEGGKNWISTFRKVPPASTTITGQWFDYSTAAGNPVPNYYASSPLLSAVLEGEKGIYVPEVAPAKQFVRRLCLMSGSASDTGTTNQNQPLILLDYLLYYPFFDMDAAGEEQVTETTLTLPRYESGEGVKMMMVAQAPTLGGGQFTVNYTNSDGVAGRVTPNHFCAAAQPSGALVSSVQAAAGVVPFIALQEGDKGVQSIQSVTFSVANGGLCAIVLVKPIQTEYIMEESRRTTTGTLESFGSASEREAIRMHSPNRIHDGAFLSFIGQGNAGSLASSQLVGTLETVWG